MEGARGRAYAIDGEICAPLLVTDGVEDGDEEVAAVGDGVDEGGVREKDAHAFILIFPLRSVGNKMHKAFPLPVIEFPLPEEVPTGSEESSHCQKKREATAVKIALLLKSRRNCQSKSDDCYTNSAIFTAVASLFFWQWELSSLPVGTSSGSGNSITGSGNTLCILFPTDRKGKIKINACATEDIKSSVNCLLPYDMILKRLVRHVLANYIDLITPNSTLHDLVIDSLDIPKRGEKGKGKMPPSHSPPSPPLFVADVEPSPLSFFRDLPKGSDVSYAQKEKRAMFNCLFKYLSKLDKKFK
nr:hypothetical protein [Tanacetum cinerariifolium]